MGKVMIGKYMLEAQRIMKEHGKSFYANCIYFDVIVEYDVSVAGEVKAWWYKAEFEGFNIPAPDGQPFPMDMTPSIEHLRSVLHAAVDRIGTEE